MQRLWAMKPTRCLCRIHEAALCARMSHSIDLGKAASYCSLWDEVGKQSLGRRRCLYNS